jgi:hypothetical protein
MENKTKENKMNLMLSSHDIEMLKARQASIADSILNDQYEWIEDIETAEKDYYSTVNILYIALGEDAPCKDIDPLLYERYKQCYNDAPESLTRKQINIKMEKYH